MIAVPVNGETGGPLTTQISGKNTKEAACASERISGKNTKEKAFVSDIEIRGPDIAQCPRCHPLLCYPTYNFLDGVVQVHTARQRRAGRESFQADARARIRLSDGGRAVTNQGGPVSDRSGSDDQVVTVRSAWQRETGARSRCARMTRICILDKYAHPPMHYQKDADRRGSHAA